MNPETEEHCVLTVKDGMLSNQYNFSANLITSTGYLLAGSSDGFVCFRPAELVNTKSSSNVLLSAEISGEPSFAIRDKVVLPHKNNTFSIVVSRVRENLPSTCKLMYNLDDSGWKDVIDNEISFSKLSSGKHSLRVVSRNVLTKAREVERRVEIVVKTPLAFQWPFIILYLILIPTILFGIGKVISYFTDKKIEESVKTALLENEHNKFIQQVDSFLENNIENSSLKVVDLAEAACMSVSTLQRKLKQEANMTANDYIQSYRLKKAAQLLSEGDMSVADVCDQVGFGSHSYFSSCFRKQYGVNPKDYKNTDQR